MKVVLVLLTCLGLCSCALVPADDSDQGNLYVAPLSLHQQYVEPALPADAPVFHWRSDMEEEISPSLRLFSPPAPPFSY
jgi:hypothetical protein